jgi:hypothetical protein
MKLGTRPPFGRLATVALALAWASPTAWASEPQAAPVASAPEDDGEGDDGPPGALPDAEPLESALPDVDAPLEATDRYRLAVLADALPAHGVAPISVPAPDADHGAWTGLARRLALVFAPRAARRGARLARLLATRPLAPALEDLVPRHRRYVALMQVLATQRDKLLARQPTLPRTSYRVQVGATAPEVGLLRERLLLEGYGDPEVKGRLVHYFDERLKRALWAWQKDHDLPVTVWLDELTRARLNGPVAGGAEALLLAMARWRDIDLRVDAPRQIVVHINGQKLTAEHDGAAELSMSVSVGRPDPDNRTPMLSSELVRVTANPSWRVPRRIVEDELQPAVRGEPDDLRAKGFDVVIDSAGDWRVTQRPGPDNPLGRVKFTLVGTNGVYLHDTPNANQFKSSRRSVSHGCVRLASARALATWVLGPAAAPALDHALEAPATRTFDPARPIPVHLVYQTLGVDAQGRVVRYPDIYSLDPTDLARVDARRVLDARPRPPRQPPAPVAVAAILADLPQPSPEPQPALAPPAPPKPPAPVERAEPAPPAPTAPYGLRFVLTDADGRATSLARHAGRLTAILFAGETCVPCHGLAPQIAAIAAERAALGDAMDFIAIDAERPAGEPAVPWSDPFPAPVYRVSESVLRGATALGVAEVLPTLWIVGRTGVPLYRYEGAGPEVVQAIRDDLTRYTAAEAGLRTQRPSPSPDSPDSSP